MVSHSFQFIVLDLKTFPVNEVTDILSAVKFAIGNF